MKMEHYVSSLENKREAVARRAASLTVLYALAIAVCGVLGLVAMLCFESRILFWVAVGAIGALYDPLRRAAAPLHDGY